MATFAIDDLTRLINTAQAPRGVLYVSGGGTEVFPMLLSQGGGSSTLLSARIPYSPDELRSLIGRDEGPIANSRTARGLAMAAYQHALRLKGNLDATEVFGLGSTSKLARVPMERLGRSHEIHAAIQTSSKTLVRSVTLPSGLDRPTEERINAVVLLNLVAVAKGVEGQLPVEFGGLPIDIVEEWSDTRSCGVEGLERLFAGQADWVARDLGEVQAEATSTPKLLLPGSFRPVHQGHLRMAEAASRMTGWPCGFELSLFHPEKPPLDYVAIASRLRGFEGVPGQIYFTNAPTYRDKARLFPACTFVVGHDTALRIIDPKFYGSLTSRDAMLAELEALGTRFLVFGRVDGSGEFRNFSPEGGEHPSLLGFLTHHVSTIPERDFRLDVSSTQIRQELGEEIP